MRDFRNLTPHPVRLYRGEEVAWELPGCPDCPRVGMIYPNSWMQEGVEIAQVVFGQVQDLPDPVPGVFLIVSSLVAQACPERGDLLVPDTGKIHGVRDEKGNILGTRRFLSYARV